MEGQSNGVQATTSQPANSNTNTGGETSGNRINSQKLPGSPRPGGKPDAASSERNSGSNKVASGNAQSTEPNTSTKTESKRLAATDLDALVEVQINGQKKEMSVRDAIKLQQLEQASRQKMTEADQIKRQAIGLAQLAKENPDEFFRLTGIDADAYAENRLARKLQLMAETPEQREARENKEFRHRSEQKEKERIEQDRLSQERDSTTKAEQQYNESFVKAWQNSGLPGHRRFGQQLAAEMLTSMKLGNDLSWDQAAVKVKDTFHRDVGEILAQMDASAIQDLLGDKILKKIREFELNKLQGPPSVNSGSKPGSTRPAKDYSAKDTESKPRNEREFREWIESLKK